tara:strand:- start:257 stop:772 length:516 start_codon:yes stop_codon:yes gene_type:complete
MILSCNSCKKKFVVPDNAISATGRLVQCSSCGNKWTQFPINQKIKPKEKISKIKSPPQKIQNLVKKTKRKIKKRTGPDLYSPEYLAKKHGIKLDSKIVAKDKVTKNETKASLGFYYSLIIWIISIIFILRLVYFAQDIIVEQLPVSEIYINYLFESIRNIKDIVLNFFVSY